MDVTVTGGSGVVGSALADHLGDDPDYDLAFLDVDDGAPYPVVMADVTDYGAVRRASRAWTRWFPTTPSTPRTGRERSRSPPMHTYPPAST